MSCEDCEKAQAADRVFPYRWHHATVLVKACRTHAKEMFEALNNRQGDVEDSDALMKQARLMADDLRQNGLRIGPDEVAILANGLSAYLASVKR